MQHMHQKHTQDTSVTVLRRFILPTLLILAVILSIAITACNSPSAGVSTPAPTSHPSHTSTIGNLNVLPPLRSVQHALSVDPGTDIQDDIWHNTGGNAFDSGYDD